MTVLEVGKPYIPGLASIAPRAEYNLRAGQHELLLCFSQLTEAEVTAVRAGDAEFGLFIYGLVVFFFYRFDKAIDWSNAPYSWHMVPAHERELPPLPTSDETRALLQVILVDADANVVRALRVLQFSPEFTRALHAAISDQVVGPWNQENYNAQLRLAYQRWPTTEQMLSRAIARTRGGE